MKILMVTRENQPGIHIGSDKLYGINKCLVPLIDELEQRGVVVNYLSQADAGEKGIKYLRSLHKFITLILARFFKNTEFSGVLWGIFERLNMGRLAVKIMSRDKYTHVHCHDPFIAAGYRWFARIRWFACFRQCHTARWGLTEHGFGCYSQAFHVDGARLGTSFMRWLRRWESKILLKAHWVITPTNDGLQQLARDLSVYPIPDTWHAVPHPVPFLNQYSKQQARECLNWDQKTTYIIAVGRLAPLKEFPFLIHSCAYLKHKSWKLVIIGEGDTAPLIDLAKQKKIESQIEFAVTDNIGLYYSAADIYVSTSSTESFGLANFEALIMGLPSICTAVGGVPEVVANGAWLIPYQQKNALVNALQTLLDNSEKRDFWSFRAAQRIKQWPKTALIADDIIAIYNGSTRPQKESQLEVDMFPPPEWHDTAKNWEICPLPRELMLVEKKNILLIAPHPDDEILGCGGTLALLKEKGCHIKVIIVTDGGGILETEIQDVVYKRQEETKKALKLIGIDDIVFFDEPDGRFQYNEMFINQLGTILDTFKPNWLFLPSLLDYHKDHCTVGLAVLDLWQKRNFQERLFIYEIWLPLPATWIVDITQMYEKKREAIQCYQIPLKYCDYSRGMRGLMMYRGLYLSKEGRYAEAFVELNEDNWQSVSSSFYYIKKFLNSF